MAEIKTFKTLQDDVLGWSDDVEDTDTVRRNVRQAIAAAHRRRLMSRPWHFMLWEEAIPLTTVGGQRTYSLHSEYFKGFYFYNKTTGEYLEELDKNTFHPGTQLRLSNVYMDDVASWQADTGSASRFILWGRSPVATQPTGGSVLTVESSVPGDGASQKLVIYGDTASGMQTETIPCDTSGAVVFTRIVKVRKEGTWSGTASLKAGSTTLLNLFTTEYGRSYQQMYLLKTPSMAESIEYRFFRQPSPLVEDNDIQDLPQGFHDILVYDALLDLTTYNQVEPISAKIWSANRQELLDALLELDAEASSIGRMSASTLWIPRE